VNAADENALRERTLDYLAGHHVMSLASCAQGAPWAAAVFYASDNFTFYFLSAAHTRHTVELAANPRVAATIHEDYRYWPEIRGVQLEGEATQLTGSERQQAISCYARKYPDVGDVATAPAPITKALQGVSWYRIVPSALYFIDNSRGFGHRDRVTLE